MAQRSSLGGGLFQALGGGQLDPRQALPWIWLLDQLVFDPADMRCHRHGLQGLAEGADRGVDVGPESLGP
jgi:hypothetical protein